MMCGVWCVVYGVLTCILTSLVEKIGGNKRTHTRTHILSGLVCRYAIGVFVCRCVSVGA